MAKLENLSPFAAQARLSMAQDSRLLLQIVATGRFALPEPNQSASTPIQLCDQQRPAALEDQYWGEPGESSLRYEGQTAFVRPGTDIYLNGTAYAPDDRAVETMTVHLRVGPCSRSLSVFGDRRWQNKAGRLEATAAEPFRSIPLLYERSFGGGAQSTAGGQPLVEPRNPVGIGLYGSAREARDQL